MKYLKNTSTIAFDSSLCAGCGRCVEVCPHAVFEMSDKRARLADRDRCMECGACAKNCEYGAIRVRSGVGCAAAILFGMKNGTEPACGCSGTSKGANACCG